MQKHFFGDIVLQYYYDIIVDKVLLIGTNLEVGDSCQSDSPTLMLLWEIIKLVKPLFRKKYIFFGIAQTAIQPRFWYEKEAKKREVSPLHLCSSGKMLIFPFSRWENAGEKYRGQVFRIQFWSLLWQEHNTACNFSGDLI